MVANIVQIKSLTMINVNASARKIIYVKKILFGILLHIVDKITNI